MKNLIILIFIIFLATLLISTQEASAGIIIKSPAYLGLNNGLVGYWTFDQSNIYGTSARDTSGRGNHGTILSGPTKTQGKLGQSLDFTIGTDYVDVGSDASLRLTTGGTLSAWIKPDSFGTVPQYPRIIDKSSDVEGTGGYSFQINNNTIVAGLQILINGSGASSWCQSNANAVRLNVWQHVVAVMGSTGAATIYVNGVDVSNNSTPCASGTQVPPDTALATRIGARGGANDREFDGNIDDVRVYNRAFSAGEVARLYKIGQGSKSNKAPVVDLQSKGLVGHWTFDGSDISGTRAKDRSGQQNHGTITGATSKMGKIGQGLSFDGLDDHTSVSGLLGSNQRITLSAWVNLISPDTSGAEVINIGNGVILRLDQGSVTSAFYYNGTNWNNAINYSQTYAGKGWHHFVYTIDAVDDRQVLYVDGVQAGQGAFTEAISYPGSNTFIGQHAGGDPSYNFNGQIDDVRVYNRALSVNEIRNLYNQAQSKFNSAQTVNSLDKGLVGYWNFDGPNISGTRAKDASGLGNHGTITGATLARGKIGQALSFDDLANYVEVGAASSLTNVSPITISAWVRLNAAATRVLYFRQGGAGDGEKALTIGGTQLHYHLCVGTGCGDGITQRNSSSTFEVGQWHHVVLTWDGTNDYTHIHLFKNGANVDGSGSTAAGIVTSDVGSTTRIGRSGSGSSFNGFIDDVRVYNRALSQAEITKLYNMGR